MAFNIYQAINYEIRGGLENEIPRIDEARKNLDFYRGDFSQHPVRIGSKGYASNQYPRYSLVMQRCVNVLTNNLYRNGPKRLINGHAEATTWLNGVYRRNNVDALFQQADRMATVSDVSLFQVSKTADPLKPVKIQLWDASQFTVWLDPEDQTKFIAVALIDVYNEQRRCRLWTEETVTSYATTQWRRGQTAGATAFELVSEDDNDLGFIPFCSVHFDLPITDFWTTSPGSYLASVNDGMNHALTQNFDSINYNLRPIIKGRNVPPEWSPPSPITPGDMWFLPPNVSSEGGGASEPDVEYLQADPAFVAASWADFQAYLDHVLEMNGVPPASIRMVQSAARSGTSIIAEQAPLILWAEGRQRPFACYEDALASLVLRMGREHLGGQDDLELQTTAAHLAGAYADPGLALRWPKMYPDLPGPAQDLEDKWSLDNRLASRVTILMKRENMTREEAAAFLDEIDADRAKDAKDGGTPTTPTFEPTPAD